MYGFVFLLLTFCSRFFTNSCPFKSVNAKNAKFQWTDEFMNAFVTLKYKLTDSPVLCIFDPQYETERYTEACSRGYGAVLL